MSTSSPKPTTPPVENDPLMQGEGNYTAARRHRESVEKFVASGAVKEAAEAAPPRNEAEATELKKAEEAGKARARE